MKKLPILILLLVTALLAVPVLADENFTIMSATHRTGVCTSNIGKTHIACDITSTDITPDVQGVVDNGTWVFKINTKTRDAGIYGGGLANRVWILPQSPSGENYQATVITYRVADEVGVYKRLAVRDRCWFNLAALRTICPVTVLFDSRTRIDDLLVF
jgi:hypothetical protein